MPEFLLADGSPFTLGMTVIFANARMLQTDDTFEVEVATIEGTNIPILQRKNGSGGISINLLFPNHEARIKQQVQQLEHLKSRIDDEIEYIKEGGNPDDCIFLNGAIYAD